jgi:type IV pilus assembly protein PilQ
MKSRRLLISITIACFVLSATGILAENEENKQIAQEQPTGEESQDSLLITLDVKDADIKDVMRMFAKASGLNIVISEDVRVKITLNVADVAWEDALNMILRANNLTSVREGKFLRIMTYERFRQEEDGVPLTNETIFLNYANASSMVSVLEPLRSSRGRIIAHSQTNSLIITETPSNFKKMLGVIEKLDKSVPQVMIEAMMVDIKLTNDDELGISWTLTHKDMASRQFVQSFAASHTQGLIRYGNTLFPQWYFNTLINLWAQESKAEILANPKVMTLDGMEANIELTEEIPYTEATITPAEGGATSTTGFKQAGIKLKVTPHINKEGYISMNVNTEQSLQTSTTSSGQPVIDKRTATTNLSVKDGDTIVIGGLRKREGTKTIQVIPFFSKIPILGQIFRKKTFTGKDTELLIFVTPHIVTQPELNYEEKISAEKVRSLHKKDSGFLKRAQPFTLRTPK